MADALSEEIERSRQVEIAYRFRAAQDAAEIERLKHKIELLEAELSAYKQVFGDTYQRNSSAPITSEWKSWPSANRT